MRTKNIFIALVLMVAAVLLSVPMATAQNLTPKVHPKSGLYGYWGIKKNGNKAFIIKPKFDRAERFVNGHAFVSVNGAWYVIGNDGKALSSTTYSEAFALSDDHYCVRQGDKYGVVDLRSLAEILPVKYDAINTFDGKYKLTINGKHGLADKAGKEILPIKYDAINILDGKYILTINGKQGLADKAGKEILPIKYDAINIFDGKYELTIDGKHGLADKSGTEILPIMYDAISTLGNAYKVAIGDKCGIVDGENKEIIPIKYDAISTLGNAYEVAIGDKWGIVDKTNKVIVEPQYKAIESVYGGLYALFSDKWIFVDSSGEEVDISDRVMHYTTNNGQKLIKYPSCQNLFCDGVGVLVFTNAPTSIGDEAFEGCSSLTSITIGNSVTSIGKWAFYDCISLTSITIPNSVTEIGGGAFYDCSSLTSITIPDSVTRIGNGAFRDCSSLTSITIPNSVTEIGGYAFYNCSNLTSITIPNSVASIGEYAFYGCAGELIVNCNIPNPTHYYYNEYRGPFIGSKFTKVTIGDGVTSIGKLAFKDCSSLTSITIPDSVTSIGGGAFDGCSSLTDVITPERWIGYAFNNISGLKRINGKEIISDGSFKFVGDVLVWVDRKLESVSIPASVKSIASSAFMGCEDLKNVNVVDLNLWLRSGVDMSDCSSWNLYHNGKLVTNVTIPNGVTKIANGQFGGCNSLESITIPNSVTSIGNYAFYNCSRLDSITIPASVTSIGYKAFYNCSRIGSITIPASVKEIGGDAFGPNYEGHLYIYMEGATPPKLLGTFTNKYYPGWENEWIVKFGVYVPENALFAYRSADVWKEMADKIEPRY